MTKPPDNVKQKNHLKKIFRAGDWCRFNYRLFKHFPTDTAIIISFLLDEYAKKVRYHHLNPDGTFYISIASISEKLSMSRNRIKRSVEPAVEKGIIQWTWEQNQGRGHKTQWHINLENIHALLYPRSEALRLKAKKPVKPNTPVQRMIDTFARLYDKPITSDGKEVVNAFFHKLCSLWGTIHPNFTQTTAPGNFGPAEAAESIFEIELDYLAIKTLTQPWFFERVKTQWQNDGYLNADDD